MQPCAAASDLLADGCSHPWEQPISGIELEVIPNDRSQHNGETWFSPSVRSTCGKKYLTEAQETLLHLLLDDEKAQYLCHYTISLLGLEQKLGVSRTFDHDQLLGFRSLVKPGADMR